jgi:hypothetical protein
MENNETTINEVMDFLQENVATKDDLKGFATKDDLKGFATKEDLRDFATKADLGLLKEDLTKSLNSLELKLLDAMDDKLGNLKGDLVVLMRKEDRKLTSLISLLMQKDLISKEEASELLALEPFPQT